LASVEKQGMQEEVVLENIDSDKGFQQVSGCQRAHQQRCPESDEQGSAEQPMSPPLSLRFGRQALRGTSFPASEHCHEKASPEKADTDAV
jgi:hypothetical protein